MRTAFVLPGALRQARFTIAAAFTVASAVLLVTAELGVASDEIPRPPGAIDNRGWELVSQADKNGNHLGLTSPISPDGTRVAYDVIGGVEGALAGGRAQLLATRTAGGWVSKNLLPPSSQLPGRYALASASRADLEEVIVTVYEGLGQAGTAPDVSLLRLSATGETGLIHTFPTFFGLSGIEVAASDDLQHVFADIPEPIDPSHQVGTRNVYDLGKPVPELVSRMPGTNAAPTCGVPFPENAWVNGSRGLVSERWVSETGTRIFFATRGDDAPDCDDPLHLYVRDTKGTETDSDDESIRISEPVQLGDPDNGIDQFLQATSDGSRIFYRTASSLVASDDADGNASDMDIYRWTEPTGNVCITCIGQTVEVLYPSAVSEDGSHVYFASTEQLTPDALVSGDPSIPNMYVWTEDEDVRFVAPATNDGPHFAPTPNPLHGGQVTPDGDVLIFRANRPELNDFTDSNNDGFYQYYRYDDRDGSVACVSCATFGNALRDVPTAMTTAYQLPQARLRTVSDDGEIVAFRSTSKLVKADINNNWDVYEWRNGTLGLLTSGVTNYTPLGFPDVIGMSADGHDILFADLAKLTPDAQDSARKIYDARVDGGFPPSVAKQRCQGAECRGAANFPSFDDVATLKLNVLPGREVALVIRRVSRKQRARFARSGRVRLIVHVSAPGRLSVVAQARVRGLLAQVGRGVRTVRDAGSARVDVRLSDAARTQLARSGHLRVALHVAYSGASSKKRLLVTLRRTGR